MNIQPYLFFEGRCDEAIAFYKDVLKAEVSTLMRYDEAPQGAPPGLEGKVMHASLRIGDSIVMVSDGHCERKPDFRGFALTLGAASLADVDRIFAALADGGNVRMPLEKTFFSERFGMVADRFGVLWMVMAQ